MLGSSLFFFLPLALFLSYRLFRCFFPLSVYLSLSQYLSRSLSLPFGLYLSLSLIFPVFFLSLSLGLSLTLSHFFPVSFLSIVDQNSNNNNFSRVLFSPSTFLSLCFSNAAIPPHYPFYILARFTSTNCVCVSLRKSLHTHENGSNNSAVKCSCSLVHVFRFHTIGIIFYSIHLDDENLMNRCPKNVSWRPFVNDKSILLRSYGVSLKKATKQFYVDCVVINGFHIHINCIPRLKYHPGYTHTHKNETRKENTETKGKKYVASDNYISYECC